MKYWLLSTEGLPPKGGGIGSYVYITAQLFAENGHDVTVFIHDVQEKEIRVENKDGVRFVFFSLQQYQCQNLLGHHAHLSWSFAKVIDQFISEEGAPDIIESQEYLGIAYYIIQYKKLLYPNFRDLKVVVTCHAPAFVYLEYNHYITYEFPIFWVGEMEKSVLAGADLVLTPSRYIIEEIRNLINLPGFKPVHMLNPIWSDSKQVPSGFENGKIICFGKISPLKGTFQLLSYFKKAWDAGETWKLELIGSGHQLHVAENDSMTGVIEKDYQVYIDRGLLQLRGALKHHEAIQEIAKAQVVIVPSLVDNLPYTVIESMQMGRVVLASKQGGQSEIITDGRNGFLFDHNLDYNFENKLRYILQLSKAALSEIGEQAKQTIGEVFDEDAIYRKKLELFNNVLNVAPSRHFPFTRLNQAASRGRQVQADHQPLVSVIIPYYNLPDFVEDAVKSVLNSTYEQVEIIVVDDGSTDSKTKKVLDRLEKKSQVKVFTKVNEGLAKARNYGAAKATGKYLAFLDADDMLEADFLEKTVAVLEHYDNVHFVSAWLSYFGNARGGWPTFNPEPPYLLVHNMVSCAIVVDRHSFLLYGKNDDRLVYGMEDWDMVMSLVSHGCYGVVLPEFLIRYRVRKKSMTRSFTRAKRLFSFKYIAEKHKQFYAHYSNEVAHLLNANGPGIDFDNPTKGTPQHYSMPVLGFRIPISQKLKEYVQSSKILSRMLYPVYHFFKR